MQSPDNDPVQPEAWQEKFEVVYRTTSRCVLRVRGGKRLLAIRVLEPTGHIVRIFRARYDGTTVIENWEPVLVKQGTFDEAFAELAAKETT